MDAISQTTFWSAFFVNVWIPIEISLKFVPKSPINNIPALVQIMAWRCSGNKPLSEPMMVRLPTHICVTRPQWVKPEWHPFKHAQFKFVPPKNQYHMLLGALLYTYKREMTNIEVYGLHVWKMGDVAVISNIWLWNNLIIYLFPLIFSSMKTQWTSSVICQHWFKFVTYLLNQPANI